ncbi:hypothetical protein CPB83DRAFT_870879 [Crepidotus variabilis]|uniref:DUF6533 domain-containing protein n=1 Tax=Crepidotus variabilis TaxID=179855 RepID=A0A9P6JM69_9AGAR|nr:hypothetical protein CPB83DRAFT_870879 [Crepidotus variabilis]
MSALDHDTPTTAHEILIHNYLHLFSISFLFYDHAITLQQEVDFIWRKRKSQSSYWFFLNRYFAFLASIVITVLACRRYNLFRQLHLLVNQVLVGVLLTLRIFALYQRSLKILIYMVGSGSVLIGVSAWALFFQKSAPSETGSGCHVGLSRETSSLMRITGLAGAWEALFVYDSIIFGLTLLKTYKVRRDHIITGIQIPLISMILRDAWWGMFLNNKIGDISVTMMSRLMLNLHRTADVGIFSTDEDTTQPEDTSRYSVSLDIVQPMICHAACMAS